MNFKIFKQSTSFSFIFLLIIFPLVSIANADNQRQDIPFKSQQNNTDKCSIFRSTENTGQQTPIKICTDKNKKRYWTTIREEENSQYETNITVNYNNYVEVPYRYHNRHNYHDKTPHNNLYYPMRNNSNIYKPSYNALYNKPVNETTNRGHK